MQNGKRRRITRELYLSTLVRAGLLAGVLAGCNYFDRLGPEKDKARELPTPVEPVAPAAPPAPPPAAPSAEPEAPPSAEPEASPPEPYTGPYFAATGSSAGVYEEARFTRKQKIGYLRRGGRTPVKPEPIIKNNCKAGWYETLAGGYVCGDQGTTDLERPEVRLATKPPDVEALLPYSYARNVKNGTPLYHSLPSREQMRTYEPYLSESSRDKKAPENKANGEPTDDNGQKAKPPSQGAGSASPSFATNSDKSRALASTGRIGGSQTERDAEEEREFQGLGESLALREGREPSEPDVPWWQRNDAKLHEISLGELAAEEDEILARRMVKGFYVAVDRTFSWNNRTWYRTTKGLIAPRDRFGVATASDFNGEQLNDGFRLPVGWTYGWQKTRPVFSLDEEQQKLKSAGTLERFQPLYLTGRRIEIQKKSFWETVEGQWVRTSDVRVAQASPPPADLAPNERWIDVNLSTQTLVTYIGTQPVFATLLSSGKESDDKAKDHRTPTGEWRIREKHLTTTMDGDGSAAGDLPYSIEEVPYAMFFHRAYALHGAFWHNNYGVRMSHGCVNLSPLDAKEVFFFADPPLGEGWHGAWASAEHPGTRVVIHE